MPDILQGYMTIGQLRRQAAVRSDNPIPKLSAGNITIRTWNDWINLAYRALLGPLIDSYQDYFVNPDSPNPFTFVTQNNVSQYPLPNDYWKNLGADCLWQPNNPGTAITMRRFMQNERNQYSGWGMSQAPQAGLQILMRYVPLPPNMEDYGFITISNMQPGQSITISASSKIPNATSVNGVWPPLAGVPGVATITYTCIPAGQLPHSVPGQMQFNQGTGLTPSLIDIATTQNLFNVMSIGFPNFISVPWSTGSPAQDAYVATLSLSLNQISVQLLNPLAIVWNSSNGSGGLAQGVGLSPLPVPSFTNPYGAWCNYCQTWNGFGEYVIDACAVRAVNKQERSNVAFLQELEATAARIRPGSNNRDAGKNAHIVNLRRRGRFGLGGGDGSYVNGIWIPRYKITGNVIWLQSNWGLGY